MSTPQVALSQGADREPRRWTWVERPVWASLAIMVMFATLGTTSFDGVFSNAEKLTAGTATAIGLLLLLGLTRAAACSADRQGAVGGDVRLVLLLNPLTT